MANPALKGMMPTRTIHPPNKYVITAGTDEIYIGSPVKLVAAGTVSIGATTGAILGSVASILDDEGVPANYYPGDSTAGYTCMVHDSPEQLFIMSEDGAGTDIALADRGNTVNMVNPTAGSATTGLSTAQLDSSGAASAASATDQFRILDKIDAVDNALGDNCRWLVKIVAHQLDNNYTGV